MCTSKKELGKIKKTDVASENISPKWKRYLDYIVITLSRFYKKKLKLIFL